MKGQRDNLVIKEIKGKKARPVLMGQTGQTAQTALTVLKDRRAKLEATVLTDQPGLMALMAQKDRKVK